MDNFCQNVYNGNEDKNMSIEDIEEQCHNIALHYGYDSQSAMLTEECAELIQAVSKYRRNPNTVTSDHLVEEIADVEIMLEQVKYLLGIEPKELNDVKITKIERTLGRMCEA